MAQGISLKWYGPKVMKKVEQIASKRMLESAQAVRTQVLETLSGSRSGRTYYVPGTRRSYTASSPGQPPAQVTGALRQSIFTKVEGEGKKLVGAVGSKLPYALRLEFGFRKTDSRGRRFNMVARPWLRISLEKTLPKLKGIWGRRWF